MSALVPINARLRQASGSIFFKCPGCRSVHGVRVAAGANDWTYNGDPDAPTFAPSLLVQREQGEPPVTPENLDEWKRNPWPQTKVRKVCHSFITDGRIQFLTDCTHDLAGQTVEIPNWEDIQC